MMKCGVPCRAVPCRVAMLYAGAWFLVRNGDAKTSLCTIARSCIELQRGLCACVCLCVPILWHSQQTIQGSSSSSMCRGQRVPE
uniref:Putative secreted protein n=1 Tax=Anopheles darlingi TaxID=43151 RepID=A0A2M4DE18_ANODA